MAWIAVAGLAVTAVGAGVAAAGAAKNAKAIGAANAKNAVNEEGLFARQSENLDSLIHRKNKKLKNLGGIFDRMESTGAFGDTDTLKNLRKAQNDFSQLAAGDFTAFESQLRKSMGDALVNTVGSGSPVGSFAELAADTQMQYRQQGIQASVGISEYLSNEASKLLGTEFGIMDQRFNSQYEMDRTRVTNTNAYALGKAGTVGQGMAAYGNAGMQIGSALTSYGLNTQAMSNQTKQLDIAQTQANAMLASSQRGNVPNYSPPVYTGPSARVPATPAGGWNSNPSVGGEMPSWQAPLDSRPGYLWGSEQWIPKSYPEQNPSSLPPEWNGTMLDSRTSYNSSSSILSSVGANIVRA